MGFCPALAEIGRAPINDAERNDEIILRRRITGHGRSRERFSGFARRRILAEEKK